MASHRVHRRHTREEIEGEIERRRAADNEADREYTTPERLAALRGEPDLEAPSPEDGWQREAQVGASWTGDTAQRREAEPSSQAAVEAEVEKRIEEEIEDFEREGSCAPRGAWLRGESRAEEGGDERGRREGVADEPRPTRAGSGGAGERALTAPRPEEHAVEQPRETTKRGLPPARRIDYRVAAPDAVAAMSRLEAYVRRCGLERSLLELVKLRASQINGCAYCLDMHTKDARRAGEAEQRLYTLQAWEETPFFTERERAALEWTEAVTRLGPDHVGDRTFRMAREQFSEAELVNLTMAIIVINGWNRLAIAFRTEPGSYRPPD